MKRTDYSKIAGKYDANEARRQIPRDEALAARLRSLSRRPIQVLDVACGTGNYLEAQMRELDGEAIVWHGLDASEAMLAIARSKVPGASLVHGRAEHLPFETGMFDHVAVHFAFHHFEDKPRALDELRRVLRPGGALRLRNIAPSHMREWWIYRFFPETWHEDEKRFWSPGLLFHELSGRGFSAEIRVEARIARVPWSEIVADAERRDISELHLITDQDYELGLARVRAAASEIPFGPPSEIALLDCTAVLPGGAET